MSVSNYQISCGYRLEKLDNVVYLIDNETIKNIHIDNGDAYVENIEQEPLELHAYALNLSESEELDERYKFSRTLSFSIHNYANHKDFASKYYAIVKTLDGEYWLLNPEMPCKITYTYTLNASESKSDFTFSTVSNYPMLRIHGMSLSRTYDCGYIYSTFGKLSLNETAYSFNAGSAVTYTNDGFKTIDFSKDTGVFTEQFDGNNVQHSLSFDIPFTSYKDSWHYNLLEFTENKYAAIIQTNDGKYIMVGFGFGLQPSFTVSGSEEIDKISIKLHDLHDSGSLINLYDEITINSSSQTTWEFTSDYNGYECVGFHTAQYLLKAELDAFGNRTGRYMALSGHESDFPELNIIDTFNDTEEFESLDCNYTCGINTSLPPLVTFNEVGSKQYTLKCGSPWTISTSDSGITVQPNNGVANVVYTLTLTNNQTPTSQAIEHLLTIYYCDTSSNVIVKVMEGDPSDCLTRGTTYNITADRQTLTIPSLCCVNSVSGGSRIISSEINNSTISLLVMENTGPLGVSFDVAVEFCDGTSCTITVIQSGRYTKWVDEDIVCSNNERCTLQRMYSGTSSDSINQPTTTTRLTGCSFSTLCGGECDQWVDTEDTYCYNGNVYKVQVEKVSTASACTSYVATCIKRLGDIIDTCSGDVLSRWAADSGYICKNGNKYTRKQLETSTDGGTTWSGQGIYQLDTLTEEHSSACGWSEIINQMYQRWGADGEICDGYNKYRLNRLYISQDMNSWSPTDIVDWDLTNPLEVNCADCGYNYGFEYEYRWVSSSTCTQCYGQASYYLWKRQRSSDGGTTWEDVIPSELSIDADGTEDANVKDYDSTDCGGYTPPTPTPEYRWVNLDITTDYYCQNYNKYYKQQRQVSYDSGTTWENVNPTEYRYGSLFETESVDCGYIPTPTPTIDGKYLFTYTGGTTCSAACDSSSAITSADTSGCGYPESGMTSVVIGDCVKTIGMDAFAACSGLTSVDIPSGVTSIGSGAFCWCTSLSSITISSSVTSIGQSAFEFCRGLQSITCLATTPPTLGGPYAFYDTNNCPIHVPCSSVAAYKGSWASYSNRIQGIPPCTEPIFGGRYLFNYSNSGFRQGSCDSSSAVTTADTSNESFPLSSMTSAVVGECVTEIGAGAFSFCSGLTSVTIGYNVQTIGNQAFYNCSSLSSITIPDNVTSVGTSLFLNCTSLTNAVIGDGLQRIRANMFHNCTSLQTVDIGSGVTYIHYDAFYLCTNLQSMTIRATTPPELNTNLSGINDTFVIYVPASSINDYLNARYWGEYSGRIFAIPNS